MKETVLIGSDGNDFKLELDKSLVGMNEQMRQFALRLIELFVKSDLFKKQACWYCKQVGWREPE